MLVCKLAQARKSFLIKCDSHVVNAYLTVFVLTTRQICFTTWRLESKKQHVIRDTNYIIIWWNNDFYMGLWVAEWVMCSLHAVHLVCWDSFLGVSPWQRVPPSLSQPADNKQHRCIFICHLMDELFTVHYIFHFYLSARHNSAILYLS